MVLEVGKAEKCHFIRFIKKTNIFECGKNGIVVEREKNFITLYATNAACSMIYATVPLGSNQALLGRTLVAIAYSEDVMLLDGGDIRVVIDFDEKAIAVNRAEIKVRGSKHWGDDVQIDWDYDYNEFFMEATTPAQP